MRIKIILIVLVFFIGYFYYLKVKRQWNFEDAQELYEEGLFNQARSLFLKLIHDEEYKVDMSRAYLSACNVQMNFNEYKRIIENKDNWVNSRNKSDTLKMINYLYTKITSELNDEDLSFKEMFSGKAGFRDIDIISESERNTIINAISLVTKDDFPVELSKEQQKKLKIFQTEWAESILHKYKGFVYRYEIEGFEGVVFMLGKLASDPPKLFNINRQKYKSIFTEDYNDKLYKELGDEFIKLPIDIYIVKHYQVNKANSQWISPVSHLWTGVKLYSGNGISKIYVGEILGGSKDIYGNKTVLLRTSDNRQIEIVRNNIFKYAYYIKASDPAIERKEWYEYN